MSSNFKRRNVGYFDLTADMVASKAGQNQVAICGGIDSVGDDKGGVFIFRDFAANPPSPDGLNIFAATGAGSGYWLRLPPILQP